jgi:hypothetical protein
MTALPYRDMSPAPEVVDYPGDAFAPISLAAPGAVYLVYFPVPRELPGWNLGNFGPATPSAPLPLTGGTFAMTHSSATVRVTAGVYRVDLLDPWRMAVHHLGFTADSEFQYTPRLTPGILRLVREDSAAEQVRSFAELTGARAFL